ncbi:hypothetical protein C0J52_19079 [Blattella germanica]|nr:hypothetical protein C0J52_19079 [Blattella germanica]
MTKTTCCSVPSIPSTGAPVSCSSAGSSTTGSPVSSSGGSPFTTVSGCPSVSGLVPPSSGAAVCSVVASSPGSGSSVSFGTEPPLPFAFSSGSSPGSTSLKLNDTSGISNFCHTLGGTTTGNAATPSGAASSDCLASAEMGSILPSTTSKVIKQCNSRAPNDRGWPEEIKSRRVQPSRTPTLIKQVKSKEALPVRMNERQPSLNGKHPGNVFRNIPHNNSLTKPGRKHSTNDYIMFLGSSSDKAVTRCCDEHHLETLVDVACLGSRVTSLSEEDHGHSPCESLHHCN